MRQLFAGMALICSLMIAAHPVWAAHHVPEAESVIRTTTNDVLDNPWKLDNPRQVKRLVRKVFDFQQMSKLVLTQNWRKASRSQKRRFVFAFRKLLIRTYSNALKEAIKRVNRKRIKYSSTKIRYNKKITTQKTTVLTKVYQYRKAQPTKVQYVMYKQKRRRGWSKWKVYNVKVEGVSLVTNYRAEFAKDIKKIGMNGLIRKIKKKR